MARRQSPFEPAPSLFPPAEPVSEQIELLGYTLLEVASALLQPSTTGTSSSDGDLGSDLAREWLQWAIELFEAAEGQDVRVMQVRALPPSCRAVPF